MKILIIGGVAGGATAATRLRRLDENAEIILIEKGAYVSYANCGLPYQIGNVITERNRLLLQNKEGFKSRYNIDVRLNSEVTAIDRKEKRVHISNSDNQQISIESYDKLILSPGASPFIPKIQGCNNPGVFTLRNVTDMDAINAFLNTKQPKSACIIGGGFIGLEMVENLKNRNLEITLIEKNEHVLRPLDKSMATLIHKELKVHKVRLLLNESLKKIEKTEEGLLINTDKNTIKTDLVILSIGVLPETDLAKACGLEIGNKGGIKVNEYLQTTDPNIYAIGDAIEVYHPIVKDYMILPLAGPANKQARIAADNMISKNEKRYKGSIGTAVAKIFSIGAAATGASEELLKYYKIAFETVTIHSLSHAGYFPGALPMTLKINFSQDGTLLGAQVVGGDGIDKRIDLLAETIKKGGSIYDLQEIEHAYAPPYSSAKDPVNMIGFVAENIITQKVAIIHPEAIDEHQKAGSLLVDVRTQEEYELGHIEGAKLIPLDELRSRIKELPKEREIIVYCAIGLRGYLAARILKENHYNQVRNLNGGYKTWKILKDNDANEYVQKKEGSYQNKEKKEETKNAIEIEIDACGMQCPGPIIQLKKNYDTIKTGEIIKIKATDRGFLEDLENWSHMTGAQILKTEKKEDGSVQAVIKKAIKVPIVTQTNNNENKTIVVFSDDLDRALAALVIANGAAASGRKVSLFFTFWGLNVIKKENRPRIKRNFIEKMFNIMLPQNAKKLKLSKLNMGGIGSLLMKRIMIQKGISSLQDLIKTASESGVEFIACSMSMDIMGIKQEELLDNVKIGGVATYLERADNGNMSLFI